MEEVKFPAGQVPHDEIPADRAAEPFPESEGGSAPPHRITIKDVARLAGVSIKTVSRVLNKERNVSDDTRKAVETAVAELNFHPNISARALAGARSYLIGLIYDNPSLNYVSELQLGAMRACRSGHVHLVIDEVDAACPDIAASIRDAVLNTPLDGVMLPPPLCDDDAVLSMLEEHRIPFVRIAPHSFPDRGASVGMDDRQAAADMTGFLWDQGHRAIAFIASPPEHGAATRRREGFLAAMAEHGVGVSPEYLVEGEHTTRSGLEAGARLLDLPNPPTAIFAGNDDMAAGVMIAAYQRGLTLPDALSVVGFDDSPIARSLFPLLTTVRQPTAKMAEAAARWLIDRTTAQAGQRQLLSFELVQRGSVAPGPGESG